VCADRDVADQRRAVTDVGSGIDVGLRSLERVATRHMCYKGATE
jgi:hypothetical protein